MTILRDKRLLITGVVTTDSIAYATAAAALQAGAEVVLSALGRDLELTREAADQLPGSVEVVEADLTEPEHLVALTDHLRSRFGHLDGALHAVAFAPRQALAGDFLAATADATTRAFHTSTHSYASLARVLADLAPDTGGSLVGLDFDAAGAWPVYNWMGVCKAGLEAPDGSAPTWWRPAPSRPALRAASPTSTCSPRRGRPVLPWRGTPRTARRWPTP